MDRVQGGWLGFWVLVCHVAADGALIGMPRKQNEDVEMRWLPRQMGKKTKRKQRTERPSPAAMPTVAKMNGDDGGPAEE